MGEAEQTVTVLSRREITVYPKIREPVQVMLITYVGGGLPPSHVEIDKSKWTADAEKQYIKEDLQRRLKERPETLRI